jgi:hypothetical protein
MLVRELQCRSPLLILTIQPAAHVASVTGEVSILSGFQGPRRRRRLASSARRPVADWVGSRSPPAHGRPACVFPFVLCLRCCFSCGHFHGHLGVAVPEFPVHFRDLQQFQKQTIALVTLGSGDCASQSTKTLAMRCGETWLGLGTGLAASPPSRRLVVCCAIF